MGVPVTKQKKSTPVNQQTYYDPYYDPSKKNNQKIINNMIKKVHQKLETSETKVTIAQKLNSEKKTKKTVQIPFRQENNKKFSNKDDSNFLSMNSNRSEIDVVPSDDLHMITKFMSDPKNKIMCKESNVFSKLININCNFEQKFFSLSEDLIFLILSFMMDEYYTLVAINSVWYYKINEILDNKFIEIDNHFIQNHLNIFSLKKGYNSFTPLNMNKTEQKSNKFRIDRNIIFELLPMIESTLNFVFKLILSHR